MAVVPLQSPVTSVEQIQRGFLSRLFRNRRFTVGLLLFLAMLGVALVSTIFVEPAMRRTGAFPARQPPGQELPLGSDSLGRSVAIQLSEAIPNSIQIGL